MLCDGRKCPLLLTVKFTGGRLLKRVYPISHKLVAKGIFARPHVQLWRIFSECEYSPVSIILQGVPDCIRSVMIGFLILDYDVLVAVSSLKWQRSMHSGVHLAAYFSWVAPSV